MNNAFWRELFWISYVAWGLFEFWVFSRDRRAVSGQKQDGGTIFAVIGLIMAAIFIAFWGQFLAPGARIALRKPVIPAIAALLMWGGMAFRLWAILTLGRFFRTTVTVQDDHRLVTSGPYRVLRHPAYTGAIVTIAGIGLFMNNWVSFLGAFLFGLMAYVLRIQVEERALAGRFGDTFAAQRARSWAVFPFIW